MKERFKQIRLENSLTQNQLANNLNLSVRTVRGIENGKTRLKSTHLLLYADFFNVSTDYLAGLTDRKKRQT